MKNQTLFTDHKLGDLQLINRMVLAPMTRCRTTQPGDIPNTMMAKYYAQRAGAGLLITEATQISSQGQGYSFTPGIYTEAQIEGWQIVTDAVHQAGGRIFLQLWHVGRMSHSSFHNGALPVAPSALAPQAQVWVADKHGVGQMLDCPTPRSLETNEIAGIVDSHQQGARNAMEAGFDGVEIHAANGYLIDQFLRSTSNQRSDQFGGSIENRVRLLEMIAHAVIKEVGPQQVGVRLAPFISARGMDCPEIIPTILEAARRLQAMKVAYLHLSEADWDDAPQIPESFRKTLRKVFTGSIIVAGRYDKARAGEIIANGFADLVAFGRPFIANPDLPARYQNDWLLADFDPNTLFGGDTHGYSDYQTYQPSS